jgi:glycosyltransferase involved in cell wall biosynthesis
MKVLNVNMSLDPIHGGGTVERTFQLSRFLSRCGVSCSILTTDAGLTKKRIQELDGVSVTALKTLCKRFYLPLFSVRKVRDVIKKADIIHLMNHRTLINIVVYLMAKHLNKPYVICPAGTLPIYGRSKGTKKIFDLIIGKKILRSASGCIAISSNEIDSFYSFGIEENKIYLFPNGVAPDDFQVSNGDEFRKRIGLGNAPYILFMGRINSIKGPDLLLKAFCLIDCNRFSQYHLVFAGPDGGMLSELKNIVSKSSIENRVHFIGYVSNGDKSSAYHEADLLVIPSRQEAMSLVVLEAGITKTPVLLTVQCGFNIIEQINGGKVVPATIEGLQDGLNELLGQPEILKMMGERLYEHIYKEYIWENIVYKHLELYNEILETNLSYPNSQCGREFR